MMQRLPAVKDLARKRTDLTTVLQAVNDELLNDWLTGSFSSTNEN
jgi:hypothetical protein